MATLETQAQPGAYSTSLSKLQPLVPILAGFNHRNKNQHRHARWWAAFNSLRRNVDRLIAEFETAAAARGSKSSKKRKQDDGEGGAVGKRARWIRDYAVPEAYLVFSQLAADNQFAVLGIVLMGVLASVHDACTQLVGEAEPQVATEAAAAEKASAVPVVPEPTATSITLEDKTSRKGFGAAVVEGAMDFGQVVSREEVAAAFGARGTDIHETNEEPPIKRKKKDMAEPSATKVAIGNPRPLSKLATEKPGKSATEKKKRKKKSKGDEFDSIFSSLM